MKQAIIDACMFWGTLFVEPRAAKFDVVRMMTSFDGPLVLMASQDMLQYN
jgi:hypothetical protein